jgi:D-glycero-alpha-D-manno-heptose-7-phosphate kinase
VDQQPGLTLTSIDLGTSLVIQDLRSDPIAPEFSLAVSAVRQVGFDISITGLEIQTHVPTPRGSGLGSSGALAVALIRALRELAGAPVVEGDDLARQATTTENDLAGNTCGGQDQLVAAYGGFISLNFQAEEVQCRRLSVDTSNDIVAAMQDRSLLCHTGHSHTSGGIQETTSSLFMDGNPQTVASLRRTKALASLIAKDLELGDLEGFGAHIDEAGDCQMGISPRVMPAFVQDIRSVLPKELCLGSKLAGAGGGGYLYVFTREGALERVAEKLHQAKVPTASIAFDSSGVTRHFGHPPYTH